MPRIGETAPGAGVEIPDAQLVAAEVLEDAEGPFDKVRCVCPSFSALHADDGYAFTPFVTGAGVFLPKKGNTAVVAFPSEGEPFINAWWPLAGATPDEPS